MLTLTDRAVTAIRDLLVGADVPPDAGLRIAAKTDETNALEVTVTSAPSTGDSVVEKGGVRVFVAEEAEPIVGDKTLDARQETPDHPTFTLR